MGSTLSLNLGAIKLLEQNIDMITKTIEEIERVISDIRWERKTGPITLNSPEIHELAAKEEFELRGGTAATVGGRKPANIGLAYSPQKGLVVAASQHEANSIAKEIPLENILAYAGVLIAVSFAV